jgi:hypothetical protein
MVRFTIRVKVRVSLRVIKKVKVRYRKVRAG